MSTEPYLLQGPGPEPGLGLEASGIRRQSRSEELSDQPDTVIDLADAMRKNPQTEASSPPTAGSTLPRPFFGTEHDLAQMMLPAAASQSNVSFGYYPAGHMVYLNVDALKEDARRPRKAGTVRQLASITPTGGQITPGKANENGLGPATNPRSEDASAPIKQDLLGLSISQHSKEARKMSCRSSPHRARSKQSLRASWMAGDFGVVARTISGSAEILHRATCPIAAGDEGPRCRHRHRQPRAPCGPPRSHCHRPRHRARTSSFKPASEPPTEGARHHFRRRATPKRSPTTTPAFDIVTSRCSAPCLRRVPEVVAAELARVLKPGGLLAMANWNPASFSGKMFAVGAKHSPPPPGLAPPVLWGDDATVRERLTAGFTDIQTELIPIPFDLPVNPAGAVAFFRTYFGPTATAFSRLDDAGKAAFNADLEALWAGANTAPDPDVHVVVPNEYLRVTATRR